MQAIISTRERLAGILAQAGHKLTSQARLRIMSAKRREVKQRERLQSREAYADALRRAEIGFGCGSAKAIYGRRAV